MNEVNKLSGAKMTNTKTREQLDWEYSQNPKSKHTPGPWGQHSYAGYNEAIKIDSPTRDICDIMDGIDEEDKANARLIAAAPELLQALKAIVSDYQDMRVAFFNYPGKPSKGECPTLDKAKQAIARAEKGNN